MKTVRYVALIGFVALVAVRGNGQTMMRDSHRNSPSITHAAVGVTPPPASQNAVVTHPAVGNQPDIGFRKDHHEFRHREHRRVVVFVNSWPVYYPAYGYYDDFGYSDTVPYDSSSVRSDQGWYVASDTPSQPSMESINLAGRDWGQDLRREVVTWDQFVDYLRSSIVKAPAAVRDELRRGFAVGYGTNADAAFDKAFDQASHQTGHEPKIITIPRQDAGTHH